MKYLKEREYGNAQRQIGGLEYENIAMQDAADRAAAAKETAEIISSLSNDDLINRVQSTAKKL